MKHVTSKVMNNSIPPNRLSLAATTAKGTEHLKQEQEVGEETISKGSIIKYKKITLEIEPTLWLSNYLVKLTMFLVITIVCFSDQLSIIRAAFCQKHLFHHQSNHYQPVTSPVHSNQHHQYQVFSNQFVPTNNHHHYHHQQHEHILLNQRQALDHLMRSQNHQNHHHHFVQQAADRRASSASTSTSAGSTGSQTSGNQQQQTNDGKLLVCYYTTRQSAPYWPSTSHSDSRSYVVQPPAESISISGGSPTLTADLRQESGFAPMLQYEPFVASGSSTNQQVQQHHQQAEYGFVGKNQQQQLVFKSAPMLMQPPTTNQLSLSFNGGGGGGGRSGGFSNNNQLANSTSYSYNLKNNKQYQQQQQQQEEQQQRQNFEQQNLVMVGGYNSSLKGKQANSNSFIGSADLDAASNSIMSSGGGGGGLTVNNGLIVGFSGGHQQAASNQLPAASSANSVAGNNGFGANSKDGSISSNNNNGVGHLERSLLKQQQQQQQQLVFSPSSSSSPLSRAFIVGGGGGGSTSGAGSSSITTSNTNNEVLDTKSQLFIPNQQQQQHNYYLSTSAAQQQPTTTVSSPSLLYQQQQVDGGGNMLKGKQASASANSDQLSPATTVSFSGAVSNAPSVPLSPASLAQQQQQQVAASIQGNTYQRSAQVQQQQQQQTPFLPNSIVSLNNAQQQTAASSSSSSFKTFSANNSGTNLSNFQKFSPSNDINSGKSSQQQSAITNSQTTAAGSTTSTGSTGGSSTSTNLLHLPSSSSPSASPLLTSSSSSSSLVSSPLSTMFDVFGAASQYLMRFKPSSLISPSSFVFNAINSNSNAAANDHHSSLSKSSLSASLTGGGGGGSGGNSSSSLLSSLASATSSATGSLIPLPFSSSSLLANLQSSKSNSNSGLANGANERSSGGILSRFSLSQSNQRREDVCGRTIQTPQRRIIGGEGARYGEFPYQVHIKIAKHQCGGALVDKQSIVTAAHCVYHFITRAPVSKLQIVIGAYDIEDEQYQELPPQYFKVNKVKLHPNFRFSASHPDRYDIAILKLDKPVKYTDNVLPVCLPSKDLKFESMVGTVTGFGKTDPSLSNRYGTRLLQKVDVPIIENNECERWHRTRGIDLKIFPEMMCAGYEDGLKDACVGDSGGPLVVKTSIGTNGGSRWTLAGITSAGFGCAQSRQPGIYHRVSHTVDWILENLD